MSDIKLQQCACRDRHASSPVSRRRFVSSLAAAGAAAALPGCAAVSAGGPDAGRPLIDVHHHFYPPELLKAVEQATGARRPPVVQKWTPAVTVQEMDRNNVAKAVLSLWSIPGGWMGVNSQEKLRLSRLSNEYAVRMVQDFPGRFGLFASLPMPDVEASLKEIEYVFDVLKADGIGLATNFGDKWPGDPAYAPVFDELNRRKAIVYFHPVAASCCALPNANESWMDVPFDTGRAIMSLLASGTFTRLQDIRWIFSHGGGPIAILAERIKALQPVTSPQFVKVVPRGIDYELQRLYYDTANAGHKPNMAALLAYVPSTQVLFGTDYPYLTVGQNAASLRAYGLSGADLQAIEAGNAMRIIPRLKI
jgi:predicted TIM-barrel fold metal-dependent hydrolase